MSVYRMRHDQDAPAAVRHAIVSMGNFDGVHRGHAMLLAHARTLAQPHGAPVVAITFDPHPLQLLRPERFEPILTTLSDRAGLLQAAGADHVVILETDHAMLNLIAAEFF